MSLHVYNYLTRQEEEFAPLQPSLVGMYVCGPTVYGEAHLGHAKVYITFDVIHRYLEYLGYKVRYVQNITDVGHLTGDGDGGEDKVARQARLEQLEPMAVVETYTRHFFRDMDLLNVLRPDISPRASGHVPEQIELAGRLIERGHAYVRNGNVYFAVAGWPTYGRLSRRKTDELVEGARLAVSGDKRDPRDFAVWRAAAPDHLMQWASPWGRGFPGWHAECTVMARKYLGLPFDIHGGGLENIFPHNDSELAQAEAAYGSQFARYWLLNNMVTLDGRKMGKSLGNFLTIQQLLSGNHPRLSQGYPPLALRFFILSSHYRQQTDFSDEALQSAVRGYERLLGAVNLVRQQFHQATGPSGDEVEPAVSEEIAQFESRFLAALDHDFNTPRALAALFDFTRAVNSRLNQDRPLTRATLAAIEQAYRRCGGDILGLIPAELPAPAAEPAGLAGALIELLLDLRAQARRDQDFVAADAIRDGLVRLGVVLEDRGEETRWRFNSEGEGPQR